jgi:hypothetical protein
MPTLEVKRAALDVRREIETIATALWISTSGLPSEGIRKRYIERRLVLVITSVSPEVRLEAFRAARQAGYVYKEASDVLHGRMRASRVNATHIRQWRNDIDRLRLFISA